MAQAERILGSSIKRREDPRFITGHGQYTDDIQLPGMVYGVFVRSPYAHAKIKNIDTSKAIAVPGVVAVYTGKDMESDGVQPIPTGWLLPGIKLPNRYPLAFGEVNHVGEAVAIVLAEDPYTATDAAELVEVEYERLPAVVSAEQAYNSRTQVHDDIPGNIVFDWDIGDKEKTDAVFANAPKISKLHLTNNRLIPNAIEPRSAIGRYERYTDEATLWVTSQNPHIERLILSAFVLGIPEHKLRVIAPDIGGGFGSKIFIYPDEAAVLWASKKSGLPVKWTATRSESYKTDSHGRDHSTEVELALDDSGKILGLRIKTLANLGAYLTLFGPVTPTYLHGTVVSGVYDIPAIYCNVIGVCTNTICVDAYRGAGRPEATYLVERIIDHAANDLNMDPVEFRRKNFIAPDKFPFQTQVAVIYDSGDYDKALKRALEMLDYEGFQREQVEARQQGRYLGIGFSTYIEMCGLAPSEVVGALGAQAGLWESGIVRVHPSGKVTILTGSQQQGQGHETTFAQIVADGLGVPIEDIDVVHGDTGRIPYGWGTYGSRSAAVGGSAIARSVQKLQDKIKKIAAHLLEASPEDIVYEDGKAYVRGAPNSFKTFGEIALQAYLAHNIPDDLEPGLEETTFYDPSNFTFPFGTHIAIVEVHPDTGKIEVKRYVAVDDFGNVINPMIVDGQVHGGIAQGIGQALYENAVYDENGQLLSGTMMDYAVPKATYVPNYEVDRTVTPAPHNPLGVKGAGEAGTIASPPAIVNAVIDALKPLGVQQLDMPLTAEKVWKAIHQTQPAQGTNGH